MTKKPEDQKPKQPSIDDQINAIKAGDKWKNLDHVADWYSEKCHENRIEERIREYNE